MKNKIIAFCNPNVDTFALVEDSFLEKHNLKKGVRILMNYDEAMSFAKTLGFGSMICGGSCMNAVRALGVLGHPIAAVGKYSADERCKVVTESLKASGVENKCVVQQGATTTEAYILVTPDANRTIILVTPGTAEEPKENWFDKVDLSVMEDYDVVLTDGLWLADEKAGAFAKSIFTKAKSLNKKIAVVLAIEKVGYKESLMSVIKDVNIISGNQEEFMWFFDKGSLEELLTFLEGQHFDLCAVTIGEEGAWVIKDGKRHHEPAPVVEKIVDTTGAGDCWTAGFLYSYLNGYPVEVIQKVAATYAGYVIARLGVSMEADAKQLISGLLPKK